MDDRIDNSTGKFTRQPKHLHVRARQVKGQRPGPHVKIADRQVMEHEFHETESTFAEEPLGVT